MKPMSAILYACLLAGASSGAVLAAPYTVIDVIGQPVGGGVPWDGDRMRGAHERVKDVIPGGRK